jgi:hypothetical protein
LGLSTLISRVPHSPSRLLRARMAVSSVPICWGPKTGLREIGRVPGHGVRDVGQLGPGRVLYHEGALLGRLARLARLAVLSHGEKGEEGGGR